MSSKVIEDTILSGVLTEFVGNYQLKNMKTEKQYEHLVNYVLLSKFDPEAFTDPSVFELVNVDTEGTYGIDTLAVFINDQLIVDKSDIDKFKKSKVFDVKFIFIQTKTSRTLDIGDFLKFTSSVKNFLSPSFQIKYSEDLKRAKEIIEELLSNRDNARKLRGKRLKCYLYFANTGKTTSDENVLGAFEQQKKEIEDTISIVSEVSIQHIDSNYIIDTYDEIENTFNVTLEFNEKISCGKVSDVLQSYIGYLPAKEFIKLISSTDGTLRKNIFYENVRDFQGEENAVNNEIAKTLSNPELLDKFLLLNNGVTIIAKSFSNIVDSEYDISDFFIVNGCQTSNMLYRHKDDIIRNEIKIPVKIIHTHSNELIARLIRSTNRQTPVPDEAFASLEEFHKRLQQYYKHLSTDSPEVLYYERRSKEFLNSGTHIERPRIVGLHALIRTFTSAILGEPQLVMNHNPSLILKEHSSKIFRDDHKHAVYFLSSLLHYAFYQQRNSGKVGGKYTASRYWICWIARELAFPNLNITQLNSHKTEKQCKEVIDCFRNMEWVDRLFMQAVEIFCDALEAYRRENVKKYLSQVIRIKGFRDYVQNRLSSQNSNKAKIIARPTHKFESHTSKNPSK